MYYVYRITNNINNKVYYGKTNNIITRWTHHKNYAIGGKEKYPKHFQAIHAAMNKYGINNFTFEIILTTKDELFSLEFEVNLITAAKQIGNCYNLTNGGEGTSGFHHSNITKEKMKFARNNNKRKPVTEWSVESRNNLRKNKFSKLKELDIIKIANLINQNIYTYKEIAKMFNVSHSLITKIVGGKIWKHLNINIKPPKIKTHKTSSKKLMQQKRQPLNTDTHKYCAKCKTAKPHDDFGNHKARNKIIFNAYCKPCEKIRSKEKYIKQKSKKNS